MAVTYIDAHSGSGSTSAAVTAPDGIQDGDILVAGAVNDKSSSSYAAISPPDGFTSILSNEWTNSSNYWRHIELFWKRASSESGNYTFSSSGTNVLMASIVVLRGCLASGSPVDVYSNGNYATSDTICRADSMTTTTSGAQVWFGFHAGASSDLAVPAAFTFGSHQVEQTNYGATIGYRLDAAEAVWGETGNQDGTCGSSSAGKRAMMVSVKVAEESATVFLPHVMSHHFIPQQLGGH